MTAETRVLIVDDHEVYRAGLRAVMDSQPGFRVVGETDRVREAYVLIERAEFDLLIVDYTLPGMCGLALVRELRRLGRKQPILVLTMHCDDAVAAEVLAAGANGFVLKSDSRLTLLEALERVARGHRFISPKLSIARIESLLQRQERGSVGGPLAPLSAREREIFGMFVRGLDNMAIAKELCISARTVETHRGHIFVKLNLHSMAELVRFAFVNDVALCDRPPHEEEPERIAR
jgi:DNA-binding NarL/FixJ family response regulator